MADSKKSALATITGANIATGDVFEVTDISDTSMAGTGTNKTITANELAIALEALIAPAWTSYTPTLTQSGAVTKTVDRAKYVQVGKTVDVDVFLTVTGTGTASNQVTVTLPVTASANASTIGAGRIYDSSANVMYRAVIVQDNSTTVVRFEAASSTVVGSLGAAGTPFTAALASGDVVTFSCRYEAA